MNKTFVKKSLIFFINGLIFCSFIATVLGFFTKFSFLGDICSHFRVQYFLTAVIALILFYRMKSSKISVYIAFITLLINGFFIAKCIKVPDYVKNYDLSISVLNLLTSNDKYDKVKKELARINSDILIIEEIDDKWSFELQEIKEEYPFTYEMSRDDNFGIALYSKIPIIRLKKLNAGMLDVPVISADCNLDGYEFEIIAVHTTPPISADYYLNTSKMFDNIAEYVKNTEKDVIVAGDINSTAFSYNYQNFVKKSKLKDAGSIFQPTWNTRFLPFLRISLDHIFVPKKYKVKSFNVGKYVGSDHFPIFAKISFEENKE